MLKKYALNGVVSDLYISLIIRLFLSLVSIVLLLIHATFAEAAIYGNNDLVPLFKAPGNIKKSAESVAVMVPRNMISIGDTSVTLTLDTLEKNDYMCKSEPTSQYPSLSLNCTGFLIAPDLMMTAGHCMVNFGEATNKVTPFCSDFVWVFGFNFNSQMKAINQLPRAQMVECESVIKAVHNSIPNNTAGGKITFKSDYALIRLKNSQNRSVLPISNQIYPVQTELSFLGYPLGIPLMYGTGRILSIENNNYYRTNLDAMPGHSGSPVLNKNGEVLGILVRGYPETLVDGKEPNCNILNHCDENATKCQINDSVEQIGEHVQIISKDLIQSLIH